MPRWSLIYDKLTLFLVDNHTEMSTADYVRISDYIPGSIM